MRRVHCPECGTKANPGATTCVACGQSLPVLDQAKHGSDVARTIVGVAAPSAGARPPAPLNEADQPAAKGSSGPASVGGQTVLGGAEAPRIPSQVQRTILGGVVPPEVTAASSTPAPVVQPSAADGASPGVARPGMAPIRSSDRRAPREMPHELGATLVPAPVVRPRKVNRIGADRLEPDALRVNKDKLAKRRIVLPPVRSREEQARIDAQTRRRRAWPVIITAGLLLVFGVGFAVFWRAPAPLSARVRATSDGHEAVEIECPSCPDGTKVTIHDATATMSGRLAQLPLVTPLALGENRLKVGLDRPGRGRDETVGISVHVAYRLRPDLSKISADKPTLHIAVDAVSGTEITLDNRLVKLTDGPLVHAIDVAADCTGSSDEPATLRRSIPYAVKLRDGTHEQGAVDIAVGIVPLRIDAPGPRVVTDSDSFVLSGHTMKGAEVLVASRPIQVGADGSFAQRMSVSSIGATNIEVRAKVPGMAPRIVPIAVQRVERLEQAAKEFQKEKPVGYTTVALASSNDVGRPAIVSGQIIEVRSQNHQTIYLLEVPAKDGCAKSQPCRVRLVHGAPTSSKIGEEITAYGQIGKPVVLTGGEPMPEIQVAFTLPGATRVGL